MPANQPFEANFKATAAGETIVVVNSSVKLLDSTTSPAFTIQVFNNGTTTAWIRMTTETTAQATAAITQTDIPIPNNTIRLFANPNPTGPTACAVIVASITTSVLACYFTPGNGGVV